MRTRSMLRGAGKEKEWVRTYTVLMGTIVSLLCVTAGIGFFVPNIYEAFSPPQYVQESRGQDFITLSIGVPLILLAVLNIKKGRLWGVPLLAGVLAYELYVYGIYTFGGVYNYLFPGYVAVTSLCLYTIIGLLRGIDLERFKECVSNKMPRRSIGAFFLAITVVFGLIWMNQVLISISTGEKDFGHLIFVFDLVIVLPAFGITAFKLFQKEPFGDLLAGILLMKFNSLCVAIALGQLFRHLNHIETEIELLGVFVPLGIVSVLLTVFYFKNMEVKYEKTEIDFGANALCFGGNGNSVASDNENHSSARNRSGS